MRTLTNHVGGESTSTADGRTSEIFNPATASAFAEAPVSGPADVDAAMKAASEAFQHSERPPARHVPIR